MLDLLLEEQEQYSAEEAENIIQDRPDNHHAGPLSSAAAHALGGATVNRGPTSAQLIAIALHTAQGYAFTKFNFLFVEIEGGNERPGITGEIAWPLEPMPGKDTMIFAINKKNICGILVNPHAPNIAITIPADAIRAIPMWRVETLRTGYTGDRVYNQITELTGGV